MNKIEVGISKEIDFKYKFDKQKFKVNYFKKKLNYSALIITSNTKLDYSEINNSKKLKVIFIMSLHLISKINLKKIRKEIRILYFDKKSKKILDKITATPEFIFGLIILLSKNFLRLSEMSKKNVWNPKRAAYFSCKKMLSETTLGIVGYGRIGKKLSFISKSFGMKNIIYSKKNRITLSDVASKSDIISINLSLNKTTKNLIDKKFFKKMRKNSFFINTSKGHIVNYNDLLNYLGKNIKSAAIDVYRNEISSYKEILKLTKYAKSNNNLILTPHIAGSTADSIIKLQEYCMERIRRYLKNLK